MTSQPNHEKNLYEPIPADEVKFREYKLLLRADKFHKPTSFHKFWKLAHHAAKQLGVHLSKIDAQPAPQIREVVFFDTPHFKLYNAGFILRKRTFYKHGLPEDNHELVLKFRHPDKATAAAVDVRPLLPCLHTIKFKEEILLPKDDSVGMRLIYSHNCELDTPNILLTQQVELISNAFPALKTIGANPKATMAPVHGISIAEYLFELGVLDFGGHLSAKCNLAVWRVRTTDQPLVAEFAFQLKFDRPDAMHKKPRELSEAFYTGLQARATEWIYRGTTKTALVYGLGNAAVKHSE
ncbi:MAG TPA: hypothetical protein VNF29_04330 [Candidatus Binataceae bacterium]|nr:hypothetical protein [Candidatus Binataceae bacterium]